ncbi:DUF4082 domain-containing protein [Embleya sp. NPDC005971]|uniref:DUF4082 domain-containing protein n=1 Tax=Embleya sp. NPDC005971 TaxID=3156724 RepID=UPI0033ED5744
MADLSIWNHATVTGPATSEAEETPVSLGTEFMLSATGWVKALHYWRATVAETGTVTGSVYLAATGVEVAGTVVTFTPTGTGWQTATITTPVQLTAGVRYILSIHHPSRYAAGVAAYWSTGPGASGHTNGILTAPSNAAIAGAPLGQGRYEYGPTRQAPASTFNANNYYSDVTVTDVDPNGTTLGPTGIASTATPGTPTLTPRTVTLGPTAIASTTAAGTPTVTPNTVTLAPQGIPQTSAVGTPTVTAATLTLGPTGIVPAAALGAPGVTARAVLGPTATDTTAMVGEPAVTRESITISPSGTPATTATGTPGLTAAATLAPAGTPADSDAGAPTLTPGTVTLGPTGIPGGTSTGTPTLTGTVVLHPSGIPATATVGTPTAAPAPVTLHPTGIPTGTTFGSPTVRAAGDHSHDISLGALADPWNLGALA